MRDVHQCLGYDPEQEIPCDACATELAWEKYQQLDALQDLEEARMAEYEASR